MKLILSFILGIIIGMYFNTYVLNAFFFLCIICMFIVYKGDFKKVLLIIFICVIGANYYMIRFNILDNELCTMSTIKCIGKVISFEKETEYRNKYVFKILQINGLNVKNRNIRIFLYTNKSQKLELQSLLNCNILFEKPDSKRNDGCFDNKKYCYSNNIIGIGTLKQIYYVDSVKNVDNIMSKIMKLKSGIETILINSFDTQISGILVRLVTSNSNYLDQDVKDIFSKIGVSHILAISGTHIMYISFFITYIITRLNIRLRYKNIIMGTVIIIYLFITNFSISIIRICLIYLIDLLYKLYNKRKTHIYITLIVLVILLIYNPVYICNVSVILSFSSVIAISLFSKSIYYKLQYSLNKNNNKLLSTILMLSSVTISVQIAIIPIISIYFKSLNLISIISNICIVPLFGVILCLTYIILILSRIPIISNIFIIAITILVKFAIFIANYFNSIPYSSINIFPFRIYEIIIYYFIMYSFCANSTYSKFLLNKLKRISKMKYFKMVIITITIIIFICLYISNITLKVNFIDVGQGDSALIRIYGKNILIDGGGTPGNYDVGEEVLLPYLLYNRINKIDYCIISHFDDDHYLGIKYLMENMKIDKIIITKQFEISEKFVEFLEIAEKRHIKIEVIVQDDVLKIGKNVYLDFLYPFKNSNIFTNNNNSIVCNFHYYNFTILFTGDIEQEAEEEIVTKYFNNHRIKAQVIKIPHHGSNTSTSKELLDIIKPTIGVICVGKKNIFGHPKPEVVDRLISSNVKLYRTDENGNIEIRVLGYGNMCIKTQIK